MVYVAMHGGDAEPDAPFAEVPLVIEISGGRGLHQWEWIGPPGPEAFGEYVHIRG